MATKQIPQIDNLIKDFGKRFREDAKQASKTIEQVRKAIKKYQESEEKSMLHNVTIKHEEGKVLEQYWVIELWRESKVPPDFKDVLVGKRIFKHEPTPNEIAQFLSDSKADFVSVVQNYRFENELPF